MGPERTARRRGDQRDVRLVRYVRARRRCPAQPLQVRRALSGGAITSRETSRVTCIPRAVTGGVCVCVCVCVGVCARPHHVYLCVSPEVITKWELWAPPKVLTPDFNPQGYVINSTHI